MKTVLFVCTGNTCRSPIAAALANNIFLKREIAAVAISCGIFAVPGASASKNAMEVLKKGWGIDVLGHQASVTCDADLAKADIIITMTAGHKNHISLHHPEYIGKVHAVGELCPDKRDIDDPFGGDVDVYMQCAKQIESFLENFDWEGYI